MRPFADDLDANDAPIIARRVRHATYYQAVYVLSNAAGLDRANARKARNVSSTSESDLSYTQSESGRHGYSDRALQALDGNTKGGGMVSAWATTGLEDPYTSGVVL